MSTPVWSKRGMDASVWDFLFIKIHLVKMWYGYTSSKVFVTQKLIWSKGGTDLSVSGFWY